MIAMLEAVFCWGVGFVMGYFACHHLSKLKNIKAAVEKEFMAKK